MKKLLRSFTSKKSLLLFSLFTFSEINSFSQGSCASPDGSFFGTSLLSGGPLTYATANTNSLCYNNLVAGQTYCWTYLYPSSGNFRMEVIKNQSCGNCDGSVTLIMGTSCSGGCTSVGSIGCGGIQYNSSCAVQEANNIEHGGSGACTPAEVCNTIFTVCITVPGGCATMDVCPLVYCTTGPANCIGVMPIELLSFTGRNECEKNILSWTSVSETNNDFYTISRSIDGENFSVIATMDGAGNSNMPINYEFIDEQETMNPEQATYYYRLRQTDFDGKSELFNPIAIKKSCGDQIVISPSITDGIVNVYLGKNNSGNIISVFDMTGRKIISLSIAKGKIDANIDLSNYPKGLYNIMVSSTKASIVQKVVLR